MNIEYTKEPIQLHVAGYHTCGYFQRGKRFAKKIAQSYENVEAKINEFDSRNTYHQAREVLIQELGVQHRTSPLVYITTSDGRTEYIGGASELVNFSKSVFSDA